MPAGAIGDLGTSEVARQMRRPLGPRGGADRHDVSAATDVDVTSNDDDDAARLPHRKAKKRDEKNGGDREKGDGQTLNGMNQKTGRGNRRYWRDSEHHILHIIKR